MNNKNMKIRKIKKDDLLLCASILEDAYSRPPYNEVFKDKINVENYIESKYKSCKGNSFVAVNQDNKVVGFMFLSISSWSDGAQGVLEEIVVKTDCQGKGIGRELIEYAHNYLNSLGVKSMMLWAKNDERLLKFYKDEGYITAEDFVVMFKNF